MRAIACLPALVGAWRDPAGGALLSSCGHLSGRQRDALERPDLIRGVATAHDQHDARSATRCIDADPPIDAIYRLQQQSRRRRAGVARKVARGFARDDLFTVVHEHFQTDTADYADYPAAGDHAARARSTSTLAYGHLYVLANNPAIAPLGEALPNTEIFRRLAARMGFDEPCFRDSDDAIARRGVQASDPRGAVSTGTTLEARRLAAARPADAVRAVRARRLPDAVGQVRVLVSETLRAWAGDDPLPDGTSRRAKSADERSALAARYPLAFISPPARNFLNSYVRQPASLRRRRRRRRTLEIHPDDAAARGIATGDRVRVFNDRGASSSPRASRIARGPASSSRRRSGGGSSRATARTRTR